MMVRLSDGFIRLFNRVLIFVYLHTNGRLGARLGRWDALLLTTTGRKSGLPRTTPMIYMADGDSLVVVASNNGGQPMPAWYLNLVANPRVLVRYRQTQGYFQARTVAPDERPAMWTRLVAYHPPYAGHQKHTRREIPIVVLEAETMR